MTANRQYPTFSYDAHARTCARNDFLGQARRTLNGAPINDSQLAMIRQAVTVGLALKPEDVLLELGCGNGALSKPVFEACEGYLGIDVSEYLIDVAKQYFERVPDYRFAAQSALPYVQGEPDPGQFTKALCYGVFQYFPDEEADQILRILNSRFVNVKRMFIGNQPDKTQSARFYRDRKPSSEELTDAGTALGIWRTQDEFAQLASLAGWQATFSTMPHEFYAAHYRYDVVLTR